MGVGKDLPYTMSSLSAGKGLEFPVLSDPFLHVSEEFVGTFDLGMYYPSVFGKSKGRSWFGVYGSMPAFRRGSP